MFYPTASAWYALGSALVMEGRYEEAVTTLRSFVETAPTVAYAWDCHRLLAIAYANLEQPVDALQHAQMGLQVAPAEHVPGLQALVAELQDAL